jgi:hypothetical protein
MDGVDHKSGRAAGRQTARDARDLSPRSPYAYRRVSELTMYFVEAYSINHGGARDTSQGIVVRALDLEEAVDWAKTVLSG